MFNKCPTVNMCDPINNRQLSLTAPLGDTVNTTQKNAFSREALLISQASVQHVDVRDRVATKPTRGGCCERPQGFYDLGDARFSCQLLKECPL